jgi:hypothetical protein
VPQCAVGLATDVERGVVGVGVTECVLDLRQILCPRGVMSEPVGGVRTSISLRVLA